MQIENGLEFTKIDNFYELSSGKLYFATKKRKLILFSPLCTSIDKNMKDF